MREAAGEPRPVPAPDDDTAFKQVALGRTHGCALRNDGRVYCWGDNFYGQLGTPPPAMDTERGDARVIERLSDVQTLYSGTSSSCGIDGSGQTSCWGEIFVKQLGEDGAYENSSSVRAWPIDGLDGIVEMSIGEAFRCARLDNADVRCWGLNHLGQLGDGTREGRAGPEGTLAHSASVMAGATQIASGSEHSCGLDSQGKVWCWGGDMFNAQTQPGPNDKLSATPVDVDDVLKVDVGRDHACALQRRGGVYCWGGNSLSQLGNESTPSSVVPMAVPEISDAVDIAVGGNRSCALLSSGQLSCWGENLDDSLGTGQGWGWRQTPALVIGLDDAYAFDVAEQTICAISRSRGLLCWGSNNHMQVGDGTYELRNRPVPVLVVD
jgi:alpha-tubulin suppressor-like RCC1 family protein